VEINPSNRAVTRASQQIELLNETSYPREVIETALARVMGDKAEQAYRP
jgi:hypothetical protein